MVVSTKFTSRATSPLRGLAPDRIIAEIVIPMIAPTIVSTIFRGVQNLVVVFVDDFDSAGFCEEVFPAMALDVGVPHVEQNLTDGVTISPHFEQNIIPPYILGYLQQAAFGDPHH